MAGECRMLVRVRHSAVASAAPVQTCPWRQDTTHAPTILDVFAQTRDAYRHNAKVVATFDKRYGFPSSVRVDPSTSVIDDEHGFGITEFRVR